jgi:excisionase family DNA binding protein
MVDERDLTVDEVAERLRASKTTVLRWLRAGELRGYRLGGTKLGWRVAESDLAAFVAARRARTASEEE